MTKIEEIKKELAGRTEMSPETETELFETIETIEEDGEIVKPLSKKDYIGMIILGVLLGIAPIIYYGIQLR